MNYKYLEVKAAVRYWEDATVNGVEDTDGKLIPQKYNLANGIGDVWWPVIELETGRIAQWPLGVTADIHYKVCDAGEYYLLDSEETRVMKYKGDYVPAMLAVGDDGFGDYIIMKVGGDGIIQGWNLSKFNIEDWRECGLDQEATPCPKP